MSLDRDILSELSAVDLDALLLCAGAELTIATRPASTMRFRAVIACSSGTAHDGFGETMIAAIVNAVWACEQANRLVFRPRGAS